MSAQEEAPTALEESAFLKHGFGGCATVNTEFINGLIEQDRHGGASHVEILEPKANQVGISIQFEVAEGTISISTNLTPEKADDLADALRHAAEQAREQARDR